MEELWILVRLFLAAVFAVAALGKLADLRGGRRSATQFGVPEPLAPGFAVALPLVELAIAVLLIPASTALVAAAAATALLTAFSLAMAVSLARGRAPDCHCFGSLHSAPVGTWTLARTIALAILAAALGVAAVVEQPDRSALEWLGDLGTNALAYALAAAALLIAALTARALFALLRAHGRLLVRVDGLEAALREAGIEVPAEGAPAGLPVGEPAPAFALSGALGGEIALERLTGDGRFAALVFTDADCAPCRALMPEIAKAQRANEIAAEVAVLAAGPVDDVRALAAEHGVGNVATDGEREVFRSYEVEATPSAVLVSAQGTIASPLTQGPEEIRRLLFGADAGGGASAVAVARDAPRVRLPALGGDEIVVGEASGSEMVLLFWRPSCGFCRRIRDRVKEWEDQRGEADPELVIVSSGEAAEVRAEGFASPVALDTDLEAAGRYGATGTPMALRIGADGRVLSPIVAGADAALELLGSRRETRV